MSNTREIHLYHVSVPLLPAAERPPFRSKLVDFSKIDWVVGNSFFLYVLFLQGRTIFTRELKLSWIDAGAAGGVFVRRIRLKCTRRHRSLRVITDSLRAGHWQQEAHTTNREEWRNR